MVAVLMVSATSIKAQWHDNDLMLWTEVSVVKKIDRQWSVEGGVEYRLRNNLTATDRYNLNLGVGYKLNDWLKVALNYTLINDHNEKVKSEWGTTTKKGYPKYKYTFADYYGVRHRINLSLTASKTFGLFDMSLRERWQYTVRPEKTVSRTYQRTEYYPDMTEKEYDEGTEEHTYEQKCTNYWRNRLVVKYKLSRRFRPYVMCETYVGNGFDKYRLGAGSEIRLTKQHEFDVKYFYQRNNEADLNEENRHVLSVGYTFKF